MKKAESVLREYVRRISDDELRFLNLRLSQNFAGDRAAVLEMVSEDKGIDKWLASAVDSVEFFEMLDGLADSVRREAMHRNSAAAERKAAARAAAASD